MNYDFFSAWYVLHNIFISIHCFFYMINIFCRWRKMRLDPPNLNKKMKVPFRNPMEKGEKAELDRLNQNYEAKDESLR